MGTQVITGAGLESKEKEFEVKENHVSPIELARELSIRPQMIYMWIRNKRLKSAYRPDGAKSWYVDRSEVAAIVQTNHNRKKEREEKKRLADADRRAAENAEKAKVAPSEKTAPKKKVASGAKKSEK